MSGLWVYGAIPPEPAGGVSSFVERLVHSRPAHVEGVIDPYWGKKNPIPAKHVTAKGGGMLRRLAVLAQLVRLRGKRLLINASMPRAVIMLAPFLMARKKPTFLILHHGDLRIEQGPFGRMLFRAAVRQYDFIGCLSPRQRDFYRSQGIIDAKALLLDNYLPPLQTQFGERGELLQEVMAWLERTKGSLIISSGYADEFYHHDWVLDAMASSGDFSDERYLICCYGPETRFLDTLRDQARNLDNALVVHGLNPAEFDLVLEHAQVYVRPSDVDSFGIAGWDAAAKNLAVVASDACRRPPQAFIHPRGDRTRFLELLRTALQTPHNASDLSGAEEQRIGIHAFLQLEHASEARHDCY